MTAVAVDLDYCTAAQALTVFGTPHRSSVIGFAYSPVDAPWFRLGPNGEPRDADNNVLDLTGFFELRAFDGEAELRWWNDSGGLGTARLITDQAMAGRALVVGETYRRLLWGKVRAPIEPTERWLSLFDARIGNLRVPVDGPIFPDSTVWLEAVEYLSEDNHGNVSAVDERLIRLVAEEPETESVERRDESA